ncbi:electron transport complex, RnfABCDGE type, B subunit [Thermoanaerobacterium thermosaccharolyticum DSM 571]|uniref:Ion-translocating oxidoreductase complex subunit B n=1 Tax=Thermoanaerobacterium thermosaccharolyticum (strain ATCC 7956 / DSM 571 / NCIMB 9385 / NCA 3814 / NCTC 13789 / WDCM 00135 / 2032) TaxID=580327 RepID=D9TM11_THETC|nr:RnfABCDGE type electron transport complex subunit B [Thermoanaerobacterium thermosaccharolyticum]ADL68391.1 electron transport complex, RnfABCDGE type, B subunit [Thermoanaerobacterium thermosaccharolyticum DSM 571]
MSGILPYLILPLASLGGMGLVFGIVLAYASKKFEVKVDQKEVEVRNALPGANCGACGYPGCDGFAHAVSTGNAPIDGCKVGGASAAKKVGAILGVKTDVSNKKMVAFVKCNGTRKNALEKYKYFGIDDCRSAVQYQDGSKGCRFGCLGLGTCEKLCPFDAIHVIGDGVAVVDEDKCTGCGICVDACPKNIIELVDANTKTRVICSNTDKGKNVRPVCTVGCIGCKACERACNYDAVHVIDNLAKIDYEKCVSCMACVEKCPTDSIYPFKTSLIVNKINV